MKRKYVYNNAIIYVHKPSESDLHIRKATELFLKKVMMEKRINK